MTGGWLAGKRALVLGQGEAADLIAAALAGAGAACTIAAASGREDVVAAALDMAEADLAGGVDILVHAGTPTAPMAATAMTLDDWRAGQSSDLDGRFLAAADFARRCLAGRRPGSVLLVMPAEGDAARASANGALDNLVKSLAVEWARDGLRTNAILSRRIAADCSVAAEARGALGHLAAWLSSDFAAYVSGSITGIDETADAPH